MEATAKKQGKKIKTGRPKIILDYQLIEKLAFIHCTQEEIAGTLDVSVRTLQRDKEFCRIHKKGIQNGKSSLRRIQFKLAEKNPAMAIFLGKNYLGQRDKTEQELNIVDLKKVREEIKAVFE